MEITYASNRLEKILTNPRLIKKEFNKFYNNVINRMSELRAAYNLDGIPNTPPPRRHKLSGYSNCWGIDVSKNFRLIIKAIGDFDDSNLETITKIEIMSIEDYH